MKEDHKSNNPSLTAWLPASPKWGGETGNEEQGGGSAQNSRADTLLTLPLDQCETMLEEFEDVVGDWYFHHQEQPLQHFLCGGHVLPASETGKCGSWPVSCQATTSLSPRTNI